ncbi:uncharacterized protein LOC131659049 [Vicia villosa]|uniref:uncharacterized protein LOC131659049 n=1 Tax=Vicia villosa TaxID=3911 RepID=UPI00273C199F|nr:uncharacterized protein LOC131659049 [Vicia villosa]
MDRNWMRANRLSAEYEHGVMKFLQFAESNAKKDLPPPKSNAEESLPTLILCPCVRCANQEPKVSKKEIMNHLICEGICQSYTQWIWHGEVVAKSNVSQRDNVSVEMDDRLEDMMHDIGQDSFKRAHAYDSLCNDKDTPLYPGCTNFTRLSVMLKLFNLKAINRWTDKSFTELLELLTQMLPEEYVNYNHCPKCKASRYKKRHGESTDDEEVKKGPPAKVVWYLPIISRFKRLFSNANDAKNLRWHAEERKCDGQIHHVADSLQWKKIDYLFPNFSKDSGNLKLGLSTDGINPFGPKQPGNDIVVYLSPLIDDLKVLWEEGVDVFDAHSGEQFNMRAMLFCTINDFPAYGNLSGYKVKGHKACPICEKDTCYNQLEKGKKTVYLGHRKYLNRYHPYRRLRNAFNGEQEHGVAPKPLTGEEVYQRQQGITIVFGKYQKRPIVKNIWKKRSVFFDLPYWSSLEVRHCIDVMHVEKNICDSVIGTLHNIQGKTKDGINARLDLGVMGNKTYLPPACYTLSKKEKTSFCECLESIKVPHGYSSNVKRLVSVKDLKLVGLKSHDCHVLMQQLLPVAIRGILPNNVRKTITRLCLFLNAIYCKAIDPLKLEDLENEAAVILCQLEMFFPPFFDIMVHLIVHLVREIRLCGVPKSRNDGRGEGVGTQGLKIKSLSIDVVVQAHLYILNNTDEVQPYLSAHKSIIKKKYPKMNKKGLLKEHNKSFSEWFKEKIAGDDSASKTIKWLSYEPKCNIITWSEYDINKTSFYRKSKDDRSTTQNSGVMILAESMHFSSAKDKNPVMASTPYFGVIEEIWEVDYVVFKVPVDLSKLAYADEPFIMASQAKQVLYVTDPSNKRWSVVLQGKVHDSDENQDANLDISETPPFSTNVPTFIEENVEDDVHAIRIDHEEGIWEN